MPTLVQGRKMPTLVECVMQNRKKSKSFDQEVSTEFKRSSTVFILNSNSSSSISSLYYSRSGGRERVGNFELEWKVNSLLLNFLNITQNDSVRPWP